jgi:hypothetical protein
MPTTSICLGSYIDGTLHRTGPDGRRVQNQLPLDRSFRQMLQRDGGPAFDERCLFGLGCLPKPGMNHNEVKVEALLKVSTTDCVHFSDPLALWPEPCRIMRKYLGMPLDSYSLREEEVRVVAEQSSYLSHRRDAAHIGAAGQARIEVRQPWFVPHWPIHADVVARLEAIDGNQLQSVPSACFRAWGVEGDRICK